MEQQGWQPECRWSQWTTQDWSDWTGDTTHFRACSVAVMMVKLSYFTSILAWAQCLLAELLVPARSLILVKLWRNDCSVVHCDMFAIYFAYEITSICQRNPVYIFLREGVVLEPCNAMGPYKMCLAFKNSKHICYWAYSCALNLILLIRNLSILTYIFSTQMHV